MITKTAIRTSKGSNLKLERTIVDVPEGESVDFVKFTVKRFKSQSDDEALILKFIPVGNYPGTGVLVNPSPLNGTAQLEVHLKDDDWEPLLPEVMYFFDIKAVTDLETPVVVESGNIILSQPVTRSAVAN